MLFDCLEAFLADNMFDAAGILGGNLGVHTQTGKPFGQKLMAFIDHFGNLLAALRQINKAFFGHGYMILLPQIFHGHTDAGLLKTQLLRYIHGAHHRFAFAQYQNCLQIILSRFACIHCHPKPFSNSLSLRAFIVNIIGYRFRIDVVNSITYLGNIGNGKSDKGNS